VTEPGSSRWLGRRVREVRAGPRAVDFVLDAVEYHLLDPLPGLVTAEPLSAQGAEGRLPNAPRQGADDSLQPAVELRPMVLRVRSYAPRTLRLSVSWGESWEDPGDDVADGILVGDLPALCELEVRRDGEETVVATGVVELVVRCNPFGFSVRDEGGRELVQSGGDRRQVAGFPFRPAVGLGAGRATLSLELAPSERIVGFGEQFGPVVKNGQRLDLVANDALGAGTGLTYKAAPVWHSSRGYTGFLHTPGPAVADVGASAASLLTLEDERERVDLFLVVGGTLPERLEAYCDLTGRPTAPPRWAFGTWMSRCRYRTRVELEEVAAELRRQRIPCDVLHIDPDWLERDLLNCDFVWSEEKYPKPADMVAGLRRLGYRVSLWELPYLDPDSSRYAEAAEAGYLVRSRDGRPASVARTFSRDGRPRGLVDFSNPAARAWWSALNRSALELGVSVLKCDFGEGLPDDAEMADGRSGRSWRNLYPLWYNRTVAETMEGFGGDSRLVWGRSGWAGSQRYPAQWGGDPESSVAGLAAELRAGLSWGLSAPGFWGHDIGGFFGNGPSPGLFVRWAQVGALSGLTRFHGLGPREPWAFGPEAAGLVAQALRLRYRLLPYLESVAAECAERGWPMMRPLAFADDTDPLLWHVEHEFLLGSDLLVVAVLDDSLGPASVEVVLPSGEWVDFWSGEAVSGPARWVAEVPASRIPVFVRAGAILPMGPLGPCTDAIPPGTWTLHVFPGTSRGEPAGETLVRSGGGTGRYALEVAADGSPRVVGSEDAARALGAVAHLSGGVSTRVPLRVDALS